MNIENQSHAHFLVKNAEKARDILIDHGFEVKSVSFVRKHWSTHDGLAITEPGMKDFYT